MDDQPLKKPSIEEWLHYGDVTIARLTDCVHVYKHPPYGDVFMPEAERQQKTDAVINLLRRISALLDESELSADSASEHDERIIDALKPLFGEAQQNLGWLSADMQRLLKSPWMHSFPNRVAEILFGGDGDESEGVGSGHPEHGRLPAVLADMQERERTAETRHPRQATPRPLANRKTVG